jgi:hypothetical protein
MSSLAPALHILDCRNLPMQKNEVRGMTFSREAQVHVSGNGVRSELAESPGSELERLAQFFPEGTRVNVPVEVALLPTGASERVSTVLEYGTSREVIFRCALPMEFGDRVRLTNRDGSLNAEAEITAVQIGGSETLVAARFTSDIPNWIIKS